MRAVIRFGWVLTYAVLSLLGLLLAREARPDDLGWLATPRPRPIVLDFDALAAGCYPSGSVVGGVPVTFARAGANTATYWDGAAWQPCGVNEFRIAPEGYLAEPTRTNRYCNPTSPGPCTTASLGVGTWSFRCEGSGSQPISAGTAVGTGWGTTSAGSLVTLTITSAGTATLGSVTGSLSRCDLQGTGSFYTSHIPTAATRNGDTASIPVAWGRDINRWCVSGLYDPETNHAWPAAATASSMWQTGGSSGANTAWLTDSNGTLIFSVIDGAAVQRYVSYSAASMSTSHHYLTGINDNGTLALYVDDRPVGSVLGTGTGLWGTAPGTMAVGYRLDGTDAFGGWIRKHVVTPGVSDLSRCLASAAPPDSYRGAAIGDSLTFGAYSTTPWATVLMDSLASPWLWANHGVNSETSTQMVARWPGIRALHYGWVSYAGGINDLRLGQSLATAEANASQIATEAQSDGANVAVWTLLPCGGSTGWDPPDETNRQAYNTWIEGEAASHGWTLIDGARTFDDGSGALLASDDSGDHIHLTQIGTNRQAALAQAWVQHTTCSAGAIAAPCVCGSRVTGVGYCCSGTWSASAC